jgi:molecular chaperone HtpG
MTEIELPRQLEEILKRDDQLRGSVLLSLADFEPWLRQSGTPFFPEYTEHGPKHVREVLATASAIIRQDAWPVITAADAATLVLSILLHDSGMHLSEDGFLSLVKPDSARPTISGLGDLPWPSLWVDFLDEASRFDARKLTRLLGDAEPTRDPGFLPEKWTHRDKLLIGEFVRRHHARLAHEVALWGVPTLTGNPLKLKEISQEFADIAGLVARSHGRDIRSCFQYLDRYDLREYKGVHAVFLMSVVRVADYLQIHSDRAPEQILRVRSLRSPISQGEWSAHEAIRDIRTTHADPEAVFVDAYPSDVKTYLKLKTLLASIQEELDTSWATLGEVYGRYDGLRALGLKLRRMRSNLDDLAAFAGSVPYIPCKAAFEAADADLLTLMIRPLYGNRPEIGVRELIQNAVDACRELLDYLRGRPDLEAADLPIQDADVLVTLEGGSPPKPAWLTVSDRGIGMTSEIVRTYFLRAGASFRRSDAWRKQHEAKPGKSRVLRSGRFGVGVLAAFLIGEELEISTRHISAKPEEGLMFKARIDSEAIELLHYKRPVGTTIRINISDPNIWRELAHPGYIWQGSQYLDRSWDWYCLPQPKLIRTVKLEDPDPQKEEVLKQKFSLPLPKASLAPGWHRISDSDYSDIQWTYENSPRLTCNGIRVMDRVEPSPYNWDRSIEPLSSSESDHLLLNCPNISVFDPDGHLPLLLQRTGLADSKYPFHSALLDDVTKDFLAFVLLNAPEGPMTDPKTSTSYSLWYSGFLSGRALWLPFFSLERGTSFTETWNLQAARSDRVLVQPDRLSVFAELTASKLNVPSTVVGIKWDSGVQSQRAWFRCAMAGHGDFLFGPISRLTPIGGRILLREKTYREWKRGIVISRYYWRRITEEFARDGWVLLRSGKCSDPCLDYASIGLDRAQGQLEGLTELFLRSQQREELPSSHIAKMWQNLLGDPIIPFSVAERRRKFKIAFETLKDYIAKHEKLREKSKKAKRDTPA